MSLGRCLGYQKQKPQHPCASLGWHQCPGVSQQGHARRFSNLLLSSRAWHPSFAFRASRVNTQGLAATTQTPCPVSSARARSLPGARFSVQRVRERGEHSRAQESCPGWGRERGNSRAGSIRRARCRMWPWHGRSNREALRVRRAAGAWKEKGWGNPAREPPATGKATATGLKRDKGEQGHGGGETGVEVPGEEGRDTRRAEIILYCEQ